MSHLGRPEEGACEPEFSLAPVAESLSEKLGRDSALDNRLDRRVCAN